MTTPLTSGSAIALHISALLSSITVANGFETDIGTRVFRGKLSKVEDDVPCAVLIEAEDHVPDDSGPTEIIVDQDFVIGGYVFCDPDNPNDAAHAVIRDIKRAVFPGEDRDRSWNRLVKRVSYKGRDIGPRTDGVNIVFAVVRISVRYVEKLSMA